MDHPTKYKKLFPPDNWCETVEKFEEWVGMTKEEQKVKQSEFRGLSKQVRNKFKQRYREKQLKDAFVKAAWDGERLGSIRVKNVNEAKAHLLVKRTMSP